MVEGFDVEGFENYVEISIDPGPSVFIATLILCFLLLIALPILLAVHDKHQKWKRRIARDDDSIESEEGIVIDASRTLGGRKLVEENQRLSRNPSAPNNTGIQFVDEDERSVHSHRSAVSSISSVAQQVVNVILDSHPRSGLQPNRSRLGTVKAEQREQQRELEGRDAGTTQKKESGLNGMELTLDETHSVSNASAMSKLDQDAISVEDAVDAGEGVEAGQHGFGEVKKSRGGLNDGFDHLLAIAEYDFEMKRILKLVLPFMAGAIAQGLFEAINVALIGYFMGARAGAAYVSVDMLIGLSSSFLSGFEDCLSSLGSQALGARNPRLAGQYIQLAIVLFLVFFAPIAIFWTLYMEAALQWLGYDDDIVKLGVDFARIYIFVVILETVENQIHCFLDVLERENYSAVITLVSEAMATVGVLIVGLGDNPSLDQVGLAYLLVGAVGMFVNVMIIMWMGWFDHLLPGMVGSFAFANPQALRNLFKTALSLCFGNIVAYGEWELLTLFARSLGQAEITAWAILGTIWDVLEEITEAVADSAEVRVGMLLGAGRPEKARLSSYKTIYIAVFISWTISCVLFALGDDIPVWMTPDATLQNMIRELIPLFGVGNIAMSVGTIAWTVVGAQGRFRLATAVGSAGSWFVTIPLAAVSTVYLNIDLQGQTAAVVIGYMISGTANSFILFSSDWETLSEKVQKSQAFSIDSESESNSSSSSSSSDSDDSSSSDSDH